MIDINKLIESVRLNASESVDGKKNFAENFTQIELIDEMLATIPAHYFEDPTMTWLDPCAGIGNFPVVLLRKLMVGLKDKIVDEQARYSHIMSNMVYMVEIQDTSAEKIIDLFGTNINLHKGSFLEDLVNFPEKFDFVIGNPPYEKMVAEGKRSSKNDNLWSLFIEKGMELLKDDGHLLYITPQAWMSPTSKILKNYFLKYNLIYLNIQECAKYFKVGSKFSYYLLQKSTNKMKTKVLSYYPGSVNLKKTLIEAEVMIDNTVKFIPQIISPEIMSILEKTLFNEKLKKFDVNYDSDLHKFTKKTLLSDVKDDVYQHKVIHTPKQVIWASRPHKNHGLMKVFIPLTTYYESIVIDDCGNTQGMGYIIVDSIEVAEKVKSVLLTDLYRFVANITRWSNFNVPDVMRNLPYVETNNYNEEEITNEEIYKLFKITSKEIDFINNMFKR